MIERFLPLADLKCEGDVVRWGGPPLSEQEKTALRDREQKRRHRNKMARARYARSKGRLE